MSYTHKQPAHKYLDVVAWHGEGRTLFYVVDTSAPEAEQPCVLSTHNTRAAADRARSVMSGLCG